MTDARVDEELAAWMRIATARGNARDHFSQRVEILEKALDEIEGSPEDPLAVQAIARVALEESHRL